MLLQLLLISLSIVMLVSVLIPSLWNGTRANKVQKEPRDLTIIYPRPIAPLSRKSA